MIINTCYKSNDLDNLVDGSATGSVRGIFTTAEDSSYTIGQYAFAEGNLTKASGIRSHAEGFSTTASGANSHAEGLSTTASGADAHAEGSNTTASGLNSHAEGSNTTASGADAHAEGWWASATGYYSHAQNLGTIAAKSNQTAIGKYNIEDTEPDVGKQKAFIIGNGKIDEARSNALTVDWEGEVELDLNVKEGTSSTAGGTTTKIVTTTNTDFIRKSGAYVLVTFNNANTGNVSLDVDGTGAIFAYYNGSRLNASNGNWQNGDTVAFKYDGSYYQRIDDDNDDNIVLYRSGIATNGMVKVKQTLAQLTRQISDLQLDYVVDTGSSVPSIREHYTWTKWNSGKMELDYINTGVSIASYSTVITGAMYGYYYDLSFPVTFVGDYAPTHTWQISSGWGFSAGMLSGTTTGCRLYAMGSSQGTQTCKIWAHIVGRWK